ncbi:MAG: EAL domain-containing response regulator [Proteobacteria bacterium]|nr:EAL domain-containing response regulator [Pseudomonadota bacterium]
MTGRVLILDDDSAVGETIGFAAETAGMEARSVTSPDAFFAEIDGWNPTHIILDLVMPEMDGVEVMRLLAERRCTARIVILSGVGSRILDAAHRTAAEKGLHVAGVLPKPISVKALQDFLTDDSSSAGRNRVISRKKNALTVTREDLQQAIAERQFEMVYQPKIDCSSRKTAGFEALVRWRHPILGEIMPDYFIPLAEKFDLIDEITQQIFEKSLQWMTEVESDAPLTLSINLSAKTLIDLGFADRLAQLCRSADVNPDRIILELTETTAMEDAVLALDLVTRLRMKGFHISIDDVGTGYSSMAQLARLPFSEMKVDKSFVMTAMTSVESRTIVSSIIELGHKLDLRVVAEGVEDEATLDFLSRVGCDYVQGFFIARPMAGDRVSDWMAQHD